MDTSNRLPMMLSTNNNTMILCKKLDIAIRAKFISILTYESTNTYHYLELTRSGWGTSKK